MMNINIYRKNGILNITSGGRRGAQGEAGKGVPTGGDTGQVLSKKTDTDFDTEWRDDGLSQKVNKTGDTMTGSLTVSGGSNAFRHVRSGKDIGYGVGAVPDASIYNFTDGIEIFRVFANGSGFIVGGDVGGTSGTNPRYLKGTGFPNGVVSAPVGSTYIDTNVTNGASSWIKKSGTGNTGWRVLEGDTGWRNITALFTNLEVVSPNDYGIRWRRVNGMNYIEGSCQVKSLSIDPIVLNLAMRARSDASIIRFNGQAVMAEVIDYKIVNTTAYPVPSSGTIIGRRGWINASYGAHEAESSAWPTTLPGTPL